MLSLIKLINCTLFQELNIKCLTLTTDKTKYGVKLRAEPDTKALGLKYRSASKNIALAVKVWI